MLKQRRAGGACAGGGAIRLVLAAAPTAGPSRTARHAAVTWWRNRRCLSSSASGARSSRAPETPPPSCFRNRSTRALSRIMLERWHPQRYCGAQISMEAPISMNAPHRVLLCLLWRRQRRLRCDTGPCPFPVCLLRRLGNHPHWNLSAQKTQGPRLWRAPGFLPCLCRAEEAVVSCSTRVPPDPCGTAVLRAARARTGPCKSTCQMHMNMDMRIYIYNEEWGSTVAA